MHGRPRLKSHVQLLRRGPGSLQLGLCRDAGVVLDGLSDAEIAVVRSLDGSVDTHTLYAGAAAAGVAPARLSALLATLDEHHLLADATTDRACLSSIDEPTRHLLQSEATAVAAAYGLSGDGFDRVAARSTQHVVISADGDLPCALAELLRVGGDRPGQRGRERPEHAGPRSAQSTGARDTCQVRVAIEVAGPGGAGGHGSDLCRCRRAMATPRHTASAVGGSRAPGPGRAPHQGWRRTVPRLSGSAPPRPGRSLAHAAVPARCAGTVPAKRTGPPREHAQSDDHRRRGHDRAHVPGRSAGAR